MKRIQLLLALAALTSSAGAQHDHRHFDRAVDFPDVPGYYTLSADLHMHTVFSDGDVWPNVRIQEAQRDELDAVAITDHIEYQPHSDDIPHPDRNRSYEIAANVAKNSDLIVIRGSEITRRMPPGHSNAIFIEDVNKLIMTDPLDVFREAKAQGAFTFWNHPAWEAQRPDGVARLDEMHLELIEQDLLHGIEVVNMHTYSDEALQIALDYGLTILGTSDIHNLLDWEFEVPQGGHRPLTLVFAETRDAAGLKSALEAGRTVVWFRNKLIGKEAYLVPLVEASIEVISAGYHPRREDRSILNLELKNNSDVELILQNESGYTFHDNANLVTLEPHAVTELQVKTLERMDTVGLTFTVLNGITAPGEHPEVVVRVETGGM